MLPFAAFDGTKAEILGSSANLLDGAVVQCGQPKLEIFTFTSSSVG